MPLERSSTTHTRLLIAASLCAHRHEHREAGAPGTALALDDAAVLAPPGPGLELLATTDQIVENKHFVAGQHPPDALGHKLLVRGLSDIAAMAAGGAGCAGVWWGWLRREAMLNPHASG